MTAALSEPYSEKRHVAEMANLALEFWDVWNSKCDSLGIRRCKNCTLYMAPGQKHYCPGVDREVKED